MTKFKIILFLYVSDINRAILILLKINFIKESLGVDQLGFRNHDEIRETILAFMLLNKDVDLELKRAFYSVKIFDKLKEVGYIQLNWSNLKFIKRAAVVNIDEESEGQEKGWR